MQPMNASMPSYRDLLQAFAKVPEDLARQVTYFLSDEVAGRRYLLGRNEHSLALSQTIDVAGFIDDFSETGAVWQGKPIIKMAELEDDACAINCSMSISPVSALARLRASRCGTVLNYSDLYRVHPELIPLPDFVAGARRDFEENEEQLKRVFDTLADEESRQTMNALTRYRLTGDPTFMRDFRVRLAEQYFEDFIQLTTPIFVDAGGFDGDTTQAFCHRYPDYRKVLLFEPSAKNLAAAKNRLANARDVAYLQLGLSDERGRLGFDPDAGSASRVSTTGSEFIDVTTLDRHTDETISFIKMDLEGWELKALQGARRHIVKDGPALAISVYHQPSDVWQIYEYVRSLRADYAVYLRHYTEGWSETVMYFIQRGTL